MKWLRSLIGRFAPPADPLATLREPATGEQRAALRIEWQEQDFLDALMLGEHEVSGYMNAAAGRGLTLYTLEQMGLMECRQIAEDQFSGGRYRYTTTPKGKARLRELTGQ